MRLLGKPLAWHALCLPIQGLSTAYQQAAAVVAGLTATITAVIAI